MGVRLAESEYECVLQDEFECEERRKRTILLVKYVVSSAGDPRRDCQVGVSKSAKLLLEKLLID